MDTQSTLPASDHRDQAEYWFQRMSAANGSGRERALFERWRAADPAHAEAYARTADLYRRAARLRLDPTWREAGRAAREQTARAARHRRWLRVGLAAAAAAMLVFQAAWRLGDPVQSEQRFATAVGERRAVALVDGSHVLLDTDTMIDVRYRRRHRDVVLERGQAEFSVAKDAARPFVVQAGAGTVRAVGTQFQVRKDGTTVAVTLLEGVVTVQEKEQDTERTTTLVAGQQLRFDDHALGAATAANLATARGWTRGELIFDHRPLAEIVAEMNRYNTIKIRLGDPALDDLSVSGEFDDNDPSSLIQALAMGWQVRADRVSPNEMVLRRQRQP